MDPDDDLYEETDKESRQSEEEDEEDLLPMFIAIDQARPPAHQGEGSSCLLVIATMVLSVPIVLALIHR